MAQDRFTTHWIGPLDPIAQKWAAHYEFSFTNPGGRVVELPSGDFQDMQRPHGSTNTFVANIRVENAKFDSIMRKSFDAQDTDLNTGLGYRIGHDTVWTYRSRGEKLRYCDCYRDVYLRGHQRAQDNIRKLQSTTKRSAQDNACLRMLAHEVTMLRSLNNLNNQLEGLVRQETSAGWQWQTGIPAQKAVRASMHIQDLERNAFFNKSLTTAEDASKVLGITWVPGTPLPGTPLAKFPLGIALHANLN